MTLPEISVGLCGPGRHEIPQVEGYIFEGQIDNPLDFATHERVALDFLRMAVEKDIQFINLYVTGLTPVLTAFLKVWFENPAWGIGLTLYHFNRDTGEYVAQVM